MSKGFTLAEVSIMCVVLGILAAILIPQLNYAKHTAQETEKLNGQKILVSSEDLPLELPKIISMGELISVNVDRYENGQPVSYMVVVHQKDRRGLLEKGWR